MNINTLVLDKYILWGLDENDKHVHELRESHDASQLRSCSPIRTYQMTLENDDSRKLYAKSYP